jgi:IS605 OrfB family transposase
MRKEKYNLWTPNENDTKENLSFNSWFKSSCVKNTNNDNTKLCSINLNKSTNEYNSKKVKIQPSNKQRKILYHWIESYRNIYNHTIKYINKNKQVEKKNKENYEKKIKNLTKKQIEEQNITYESIYNYYSTRTAIRQSNVYKKERKTTIPAHTLDNAIKDALDAIKIHIEQIKNKTIKFFRMRYKKKACPRQTLFLERVCFTKTSNQFCSSVFKYNDIKKAKLKKLNALKTKKEIKHDKELEAKKSDEQKKKEKLEKHIEGMKTKEHFYNKVSTGVRLSIDFRLNYVILNIPIKTKCKENTNTDVCGIDPGVRTFQTVYSNNTIYEFGLDNTVPNTNIKNKLKEQDKIRFKRGSLEKTIKNCTNIKKEKELKIILKKLTKRYRIISEKIKNQVKDMHHKVSNELVKKFKCIIIGKLSTMDIIKKKSNLSRMNKRLTCALMHFSFRQLLEHKCKLNNVKYLEVGEWYTSRTCSKCKSINEQKTCSKDFKCEKCKFALDRDVNASKNILCNNWNKLTKKEILVDIH